MLANSNIPVLTAQSFSVVHKPPCVCHTQQPALGGILYNADLLEDVVEERFDHQENRRVEKAKRGKMTRRLSRGYSKNWN